MTLSLPLDLPDPQPEAARLQHDWVPTREAGLSRTAQFLPRMGRHYRGQRNYDRGTVDRSNVSVLSPWITRRLVTEEEVVRACLARHSLSGADKFVQEVVWRTYFKGWMEQRPEIWAAYCRGRDTARGEVGGDPALRAAEEGRTGIDAFDVWAHELVETGYLHNHARMWFASIWIFTLRLPWQLGADFFLRHLLDGDAASNTLGWRWVAGLHTRGKNYVARASNIAKYTEGRLTAGGLAQNPEPLDEGEAPARRPLGAAAALPVGMPVAVLATETDCRPEELLRGLDVVGAATIALSHQRSDLPVSDAVAGFDRGALVDTGGRMASAGMPDPQVLEPGRAGSLAALARGAGAEAVVTPQVPTGWVRDWLDGERGTLEAAGIALIEPRRDWDDTFWPHATAGYFRVKQAIPGALDSLGIGI